MLVMDKTQNSVQIKNYANCDVGLHSYLRTYGKGFNGNMRHKFKKKG
jgi:hypothetical protein